MPSIKSLIIDHPYDDIINQPNFRKDIKSLETFFREYINSKGGIGGLDFELKVLISDDLNLDISLGYDKYASAVINFLKTVNPDIWLDMEPVFGSEKYKNIISDNINRIHFIDNDPVNTMAAGNIINMNNSLFDNRESFAFFSKCLKPKTILFIQNAYFSNDESLKKYKDAAEKNGWKGDFLSYSFTEEQEKILQSGDYNLETIKKLYQENLEPILNDLPDGSLIAENFPYHADNFDEFLEDKFTDKNFIRFSTHSHKNTHFTDTVRDCIELNEIVETIILSSNQAYFEYFKDLFRRISVILACHEVTKGKKFNSSQEAVSQIPSLLNKLDGKTNIALNYGIAHSFKNNEINNKTSVALKSTYMKTIDQNVNIYFSSQPTKKNEKIEIVDVIYTYIDLFKIHNIDVSEGFWIGDFEFEISSAYTDPIQYIRFNNKSLVNETWQVKEIGRRTFDDIHHVKYRIVGAFDFEPDIGNFPFDNQYLSIETSLERSLTNAILNPPISELVDKEFDCKGWFIKNAQSGITRTLNQDRLGSDFETTISISENNIRKWTVSRQNFVPALRSFIPLFVLIFLSWYSSFYTIENAKNAVTLNTTVFLAGVALYFSAEKPKGSSFTYVDKLFIYFYIAIGSFILSEFTVIFGEQIYDITHIIWRITIPTLLSVVGFSLIKNILKVQRQKKILLNKTR